MPDSTNVDYLFWQMASDAGLLKWALISHDNPSFSSTFSTQLKLYLKSYMVQEYSLAGSIHGDQSQDPQGY